MLTRNLFLILLIFLIVMINLINGFQWQRVSQRISHPQSKQLETKTNSRTNPIATTTTTKPRTRTTPTFSPNILRYLVGISLGIASFFPTSLPTFAKEYPLFEEAWTITGKNFFDSKYNGNDWNQVKQEILTKLDEGADEKKSIQFMLKKLDDKYTKLYDKAAFESLFKYDAAGVGLIFESDSTTNKVFISSPPIPGSTSEKAGLKKGDVIYSINNIPTTQLNAIGILELLSNDESKQLTIEYSPANNPDDKKTVTLLRVKEQVSNPVKYRLQQTEDGKKIGYVQLKEFNSQAVPGVKQALEAFNAQQADLIILDLRGNTGGGFQFALNIGGMFMKDKVMVTAVGRENERTTFKTSYPPGVLSDKPLIVVTDGLSASATEALVAGLKDNCRAVVAGARSFGKGKIQGVFGLADGEGLTLTVAQYLSPKGTVIQAKGIEPDLPISVMNPYVNYLLGNQDLDISQLDFNKAQEIQSLCNN